MRKENIIEELVKEIKKRVDVEVLLRTVEKNNATFNALTFVNEKISPVIYLDAIVNSIIEGKSTIEYGVNKIIEAYEKAKEDMHNNLIDIDNIDKEFILTNVIPTLVQGKNNKKYLNGKVTRNFLDLNIVYKVRLEKPDVNDNYKSFTVTESLLSENDLTEEELYKSAMENLAKEKEGIIDIVKLLDYKMKGCDVDFDTVNDITGNENMLTARTSVVNGANILLKEKFIKDVSDKFKKDLVILPSSVHEIIICPITTDLCIKDLVNMVHDINNSVVEDEDVLSNSVYIYDRKENKIVVFE